MYVRTEGSHKAYQPQQRHKQTDRLWPSHPPAANGIVASTVDKDFQLHPSATANLFLHQYLLLQISGNRDSSHQGDTARASLHGILVGTGIAVTKGTLLEHLFMEYLWDQQ